MKCIVRYKIPHLHLLAFGIEAEDTASARRAAAQAFDTGIHNSADGRVRLLESDFEEAYPPADVGGEPVEVVEQLPDPGYSVRAARADQLARRCAEELLHAVRAHEAHCGAIDPRSMENAIRLAQQFAAEERALRTSPVVADAAT